MRKNFEFKSQEARKGNGRNFWISGFQIIFSLLLIVAFLTSIALLTAVQTRLAEQRWTKAPGQEAQLSADPAATKSYETVKFYSSNSIVDALGDLKVMANRACLIVPIGDDYANEKKGEIMSSTRTSDFMLMIADKDFSKDASQMMGSPASPGILALKDLAVTDFVRRPLTIAGRVVPVQPGAGALVELQWQEEKEKNLILRGRECWNQIFRVAAGHERVEVGRRV